jgi:hypothetical protein
MSEQLKQLKKNGYVHNLLLSLDQSGNAVFRGNPDSTISARTGYFAARGSDSFWVAQERLINYSFKPLDGPNHCRQAWQADKNEEFYDAGVVAKVGMALTVIPLCFLIGTALRIYKAFT